MEPQKVYLLYEDEETGYYGSRDKIRSICGIFSSYEEANKYAYNGLYLIKEFNFNEYVDCWSPYEDRKF